MVRIAVGPAEEPESGVVGGEVAGAVQTALLGAVLGVQSDVVQDLGDVTAVAPEDVGGGQQDQVVVARQKAHPEGELAQVGAFQGPERELMVAYQGGHVLAPGDRGAGLPQDPADHQVAPPRVSVRGHPTLGVLTGAQRFGHVVEERRGEQQDPLLLGPGPPLRQVGQGLAGHAGVGLHVPLGVVDGVLLHPRQGANPGEGLAYRGPVRLPERGSGAQFSEPPHRAPPGRRVRWRRRGGPASGSPSPVRRW